MGWTVIWSCPCAASSAFEVCLLIACGLCRAVQEHADKAGRPGAEESYRAAQACGAACFGSKREFWGGRRPGERLAVFPNAALAAYLLTWAPMHCVQQGGLRGVFPNVCHRLFSEEG